MLLNIKPQFAYRHHMMTHPLTKLALVTSLLLGLASAASAGCVAEYKAKKSNPTQYEHSTMQIAESACNKAAAEAVVRDALADRGWTLLAIVSVTKTG